MEYVQSVSNVITVNEDEEDPDSRRKSIACFVEPYNFYDESEKLALFKFKSTAINLGYKFNFIYKKDVSKIKDYNALFIRATTDPNNITFVLSTVAEQKGLKVIDDPHSILICSNKVTLHSIFEKNNIPSPKSCVFYGDYSSESIQKIFNKLGTPVVIKTPNTSFSSFVDRAYNEQEFCEIARNFLKNAQVLVVQEYIQSDFDWRVGILNNEILYLCKYFYPKDGWKVNIKVDGKVIWGDTLAISKDLISPKLKDICIKLSKCIGNGLYGIDVKETDNGYKVIEINDNPSIYSGYEDVVDKDIYEKIIKVLVS